MTPTGEIYEDAMRVYYKDGDEWIEFDPKPLDLTEFFEKVYEDEIPPEVTALNDYLPIGQKLIRPEHETLLSWMVWHDFTTSPYVEFGQGRVYYNTDDELIGFSYYTPLCQSKIYIREDLTEQ